MNDNDTDPAGRWAGPVGRGIEMNAEQLQAMKINQERAATERIRRENAVALLAEKEREIARLQLLLDGKQANHGRLHPESPLICFHCGKRVPVAFNQCTDCKEAAEQRLQEAQALNQRQMEAQLAMAESLRQREAENLVALTLEEQAIITKLRTGKRLVTCSAVDRPHSFNLCNSTEGHSFPKLLDEAELVEKEPRDGSMLAKRIAHYRARAEAAESQLVRQKRNYDHLDFLFTDAEEYLADVQCALRQREAELEQRWIAVESELPKNRGQYLVWVYGVGNDGEMVRCSMEARFDKNNWFMHGGWLSHEVQGWQPLPSPPKEAK